MRVNIFKKILPKKTLYIQDNRHRIEKTERIQKKSNLKVLDGVHRSSPQTERSPDIEGKVLGKRGRGRTKKTYPEDIYILERRRVKFIGHLLRHNEFMTEYY